MPKKKTLSVGDVFAIRMRDDGFAVGQILDARGPMNSVGIALFDERCARPDDAMTIDISEERAFSIIFCTRDLLDDGVWTVVGNRPIEIRPESFPHTKKVIGSFNVMKLVEAYFGLVLWDDWHDPQYLDKLLISADKKPKNVVHKH